MSSNTDIRQLARVLNARSRDLVHALGLKGRQPRALRFHPRARRRETKRNG